MLKKLELLTPTSCLNKAAVDEPIFVLRAKDFSAPQTLRLWAAMSDGTHEPDKIAEALATADAMEKWRAQRYDAKGDGLASTPRPARAEPPLPYVAPPWAAPAAR